MDDLLLRPEWQRAPTSGERVAQQQHAKKRVYSRDDLLRHRGRVDERQNVSAGAGRASPPVELRQEKSWRDGSRESDREPNPQLTGDRERSPTGAASGARLATDRIRFSSERPRLALKPRSSPPSSTGVSREVQQQAHSVSADEKSKSGISFLYLDPQGVTQGPFTREEMAAWHEAGYFTPDLPTRTSVDPTFRRLDELLPIILGHVEALEPPSVPSKQASASPPPLQSAAVHESRIVQAAADLHEIDDLHSKHIENLLHDHEAEEKSRSSVSAAWGPPQQHISESSLHPARLLGPSPMHIMPHSFVPELPPFPPGPSSLPPMSHIHFHPGSPLSAQPGMFPAGVPPHFAGDAPHLLAFQQHLHLQAYLHHLHMQPPPISSAPNISHPPPSELPEPPVASVWDLDPTPQPAPTGLPVEFNESQLVEPTLAPTGTYGAEDVPIQPPSKPSAWKTPEFPKSTLAEIQKVEEERASRRPQPKSASPVEQAPKQIETAVQQFSAMDIADTSDKPAPVFQEAKSKKKKKGSSTGSASTLASDSGVPPLQAAHEQKQSSQLPSKPKPSVHLNPAPAQVAPVSVPPPAPRPGPVWKAPAVAPPRTLQEIQAEEASEQKRRMEEHARLEAEVREEDRRVGSSSGPWGNRTIAAPSLRDILLQEKEKSMSSSATMHVQPTSPASPAPRAAQAVSRPARVEATVWGATTTSKPRTLADIQAEELEQKQRLSQTQQAHIAHNTASLQFSSAWERSHGKQTAPGLTQPTVASLLSSSTTRPAERAVAPAVPDDDNFWDAPAEATQKGPQQVLAPRSSDSFAVWCEQKLRALRLDIDTDTLMSIFSSEMSDRDMRDYLHDILGESSGTRDFAEEFIQRWRLSPALKKAVQLPSSTGASQTTPAASGTKKRGKKQVPLALSFSVASTGGPNRGEIVGSTTRFE